MKYLVIALVLVLATSAFGLDKKAYQMREDFGMELQCPDALQFYYYIPCPTYSWFWAYTGWDPGDIIGMGFPIGEQGTGGYDPVDPYDCQHIDRVRVLDFAGYGIYYPGLFTIELCLWCWHPDFPAHHMPLWCSGPLETGFGWNYFWVDPVVELCECPWGGEHQHHPGPVVLLTAQMIGPNGVYPAWGMDNISTPLEAACIFLDYGCMPVCWPRLPPGYGYDHCAVHGGYFGTYFWEYVPPLGFLDGRDTTPDGTQFGFIELAWRVYICCYGPTSSQPSTWGNIKSMYRE
jgi:hypothetical protein